MKLSGVLNTLLDNSALGWAIQTAPTPMRRAVSAYVDYTGTVSGTVKATATSHGFVDDDIVVISGTTNYNGTYSITKIDANNFYFTAPWVADDGASIAEKADSLELSRVGIGAEVKVVLYTSAKVYYRFSLTDISTSGMLVATTDLFIADTTEKTLSIPWGITKHVNDKIYLILLPAANGAPTISAVVQ